MISAKRVAFSGSFFTSVMAVSALLLSMVLPSGVQAQSGKVDAGMNQRELKIESVRFHEVGYFPYKLLIGEMYMYSDKMIPSDLNSWPYIPFLNEDEVAIRVFEETEEQTVLSAEPVENLPQRLNLLTIISVGPGIADSAIQDSPLHPAFGKTLGTLKSGMTGEEGDGFYNLALALCWGDREWPERIRSQEQLDTVIADLQEGSYLYPGQSIGSIRDCMTPLLNDLDWLQRAEVEKAEEATKRNRTLNMFFPPEDRNFESAVLLITDGTAFREGSLTEMVEALQMNNFPMYTVGLTFSREGNEGLSRLRDLYEAGPSNGIPGKFTTVGSLAEMEPAIRQLQRRWSRETYLIKYISSFSGKRHSPLPNIEARWIDNRYQAQAIAVSPPKFQARLHQFLWFVTAALIIGLFVYLLYVNQIWPFNPKLRVVKCPSGCGRMIPDEWPRCKFCEMEAAWGRLVLLSGDRAGQVFFLKEDTYSLGASAKDDILLTQNPDSAVQETHASLHWLRQGQKIVVQGRSGDVRLGEAEIPAGGANLAFGDILEFGDGGVSAILLRGVSLVR